jgi:hypothetical protein
LYNHTYKVFSDRISLCGPGRLASNLRSSGLSLLSMCWNYRYVPLCLAQSCYLFFSFFLMGLGFELKELHFANQKLYHMSHTSSPFCSSYFGDGDSRTICPGWPQTLILTISASQVARIIGVSHWHPAKLLSLNTYNNPWNRAVLMNSF